MNKNNSGGRPRKSGGKGANKHCVFGNCKSDSRRKDSDKYNFFSFPKPCLDVRKNFVTANTEHKSSCDSCEKCSRWIIKCKRDDNKFKSVKDVKKDTYICTKHFVKEELLVLYPDPLPEDTVYKLNNRSRKRKLSTVDVRETKVVKVANLMEGGEEQGNKVANIIDQEIKEVSSTCEVATQTEETMVHFSKSSQTTFSLKDQEMLQNKIINLEKVVSSLKKKLKKENAEDTSTTIRMQQFESDLQKNDKMCKFYTNLYFSQILHLIAFLNVPLNFDYWGECSSSTSKKFRKKKLTVQQQIILMLVRLRSGLLVRDLAFRFQLSEGLISKTVITWIQYMFHKFNSIRPLMFPSRDKIRETLPHTFKKLKNIRVIIDCAEFFCQSPSNFEQQGNLYSQYKAHTTYKVLLGCTPNGAISFISELYEGSISDREMVKQSKLMDLLEDGDLVLADRGFTIKDLAEEKNVILNIPPFLKGRNTLTPEEEIETKRIAKERIYIEHVVGKVKQFRLLQKVLPLRMRSVMSQIVFVSACLVNFQEPIVWK